MSGFTLVPICRAWSPCLWHTLVHNGRKFSEMSVVLAMAGSSLEWQLLDVSRAMAVRLGL